MYWLLIMPENSHLLFPLILNVSFNTYGDCISHILQVKKLGTESFKKLYEHASYLL